MREIRDAFDALDPGVRQALELAYFGGLDIHAIADIVGKPVHELRPLLRDALLAMAAVTRDVTPGPVARRSR